MAKNTLNLRKNRTDKQIKEYSKKLDSMENKYKNIYRNLLEEFEGYLEGFSSEIHEKLSQINEPKELPGLLKKFPTIKEGLNNLICKFDDNFKKHKEEHTELTNELNKTLKDPYLSKGYYAHWNEENYHQKKAEEHFSKEEMAKDAQKLLKKLEQELKIYYENLENNVKTQYAILESQSLALALSDSKLSAEKCAGNASASAHNLLHNSDLNSTQTMEQTEPIFNYCKENNELYKAELLENINNNANARNKELENTKDEYFNFLDKNLDISVLGDLTCSGENNDYSYTSFE